MTNWLVFIYGDLSRTVPEGSDDVRLWQNEGYELVWDKAPSQFEGQAFAAINHGCMPDDYDDRLMPGLIWEPITLYRSVSIQELEAIVVAGDISGGGNLFNEFDPRPFVFFADKLNEQTIGQGERADRVAEYLAIKSCFDEGMTREEMAASVRPRYLDLYAEEREARERMTYTSCVMETTPMKIGFRYSCEDGGRTGMNGDNEYGLFPGQVKTDQIVALHWVKDREIVHQTTFDEVSDILDQLRDERTPAEAPVF
ncbi:hypothetical protein [Mesorhizobium sp. SP-1A]|uniref:hypothetical protein n=1 Tax=Mesorhizobium sp. SP-1A TaxID=3077840 RepID=UPI0028F6E336|nr:hypothetical protein [Mesorhizobium sp. SP-1A]